MRTALLSLVFASVVAGVSIPLQAQPPQPTFDRVYLKRSAVSGVGSSFSQAPDGSLSGVGVPLSILLSRAYSVKFPDIVGVPEWARAETYDVQATGSSVRTADERAAMVRAMLADRFKLAAHLEDQQKLAFDLVRARRDGSPGTSLTPADVDCTDPVAAQRDARRFLLPPPCVMRLGMDGMEGNVTIPGLLRFLEIAAGAPVTDMTGLTGTYQVRLRFDRTPRLPGTVRPSARPSQAPDLFRALEAQLGLRLEPSRETRQVLVVDRLEFPRED